MSCESLKERLFTKKISVRILCFTAFDVIFLQFNVFLKHNNDIIFYPHRKEAIKIKLFDNIGKGKKQSGRKSTASNAVSKRVVIIAGAAALLLIAALFTGLFIINSIDTVYPGVTVCGIDISGMNVKEAEVALSEIDISATVSMPNDDTFTVSGEEVGIPSSPAGIASFAVQYGRESNIFSTAVSYLKSFSNPTELTGLLKEDMSLDAVAAAVTPYVKAYNTAVGGVPYEINGDKLIIKKGAGQISADVSAVAELTAEALRAAFDTGISQSSQFTLNDVKPLTIQNIYDAVYVAPADAAYDSATGGITPSVTGISFDLSSAQPQYSKAALGDTISIDLIFTKPEIIAKTADELLYRDILHSMSTHISGGYNRKNNITLAAAAINGCILEPDEIFSFNDTVGERTTAKGYLEGTSYIGGKSVPDVGGGICQVSSSLYCCAIYSDLEIVDRSNHMFTVSYLPLGIDATVNWGTCDFQFKNNTGFPIRIETYVDDYEGLVMVFHGTKTNDLHAEITYSVRDVYDYETVEKEDASIPQGETKVDTYGITGYLVYTYRSWYNSQGELVESEFLDTSSYSSRDEIILVPIPEPEPEPEPTPTPTPTPTPEPEPTVPSEPTDEGSDTTANTPA